MEREFDTYNVSHVRIYLQQFPSYSNRKCKKSPFSRTTAHIFVSPGDAPATITQYVVWMERQFNACQTSRSMYLSIFNSFRVIRCLSQCVTPKIARMRSIKWCHFQWPWTNLNPVFKVTPVFDAKYLTNGYRYSHSYYRRRIGNCTQAFDWHQFQLSRVTSNPDFKVTILFNVK